MYACLYYYNHVCSIYEYGYDLNNLQNERVFFKVETIDFIFYPLYNIISHLSDQFWECGLSTHWEHTRTFILSSLVSIDIMHKNTN